MSSVPAQVPGEADPRGRGRGFRLQGGKEEVTAKPRGAPWGGEMVSGTPAGAEPPPPRPASLPGSVVVWGQQCYDPPQSGGQSSPKEGGFSRQKSLQEGGGKGPRVRATGAPGDAVAHRQPCGRHLSPQVLRDAPGPTRPHIPPHGPSRGGDSFRLRARGSQRCCAWEPPTPDPVSWSR